MDVLYTSHPAPTKRSGTVLSTQTPCGEPTCEFIFEKFFDDSAEAACNAWGTVPKEVGANSSKPDLKIACEMRYGDCLEVKGKDDGNLVIP